MSVQRDLSVLYGAYNSFLTLHFPDGHPMRLLECSNFQFFSLRMVLKWIVISIFVIYYFYI